MRSSAPILGCVDKPLLYFYYYYYYYYYYYDFIYGQMSGLAEGPRGPGGLPRPVGSLSIFRILRKSNPLLVLFRDEITHRDFWRSEKSLLCDVSDFPWPRKSLICDVGDYCPWATFNHI